MDPGSIVSRNQKEPPQLEVLLVPSRHKSSIIEERKILLFGIEAIFLFGYMKEFHEYYLKLLQLAEYEMDTDEKRIAYGYQPSSHEDLTLLREKYLLERVAGTGDELSQIRNLTQWVNERLPHGNVSPPEQVNALHVLGLSDSGPIQMNCYVIATVLNEVLLSLGFQSRRVHCRSYDAYDLDSHVVTLVYSNTLSKWVCMDGSWNCYLTDDSRIPLSLEEFRERLSSNQPVWVNGESTETDWSIFIKVIWPKICFGFIVLLIVNTIMKLVWRKTIVPYCRSTLLQLN